MKQETLTHYGKVRLPSIKADETEPGGISHFRINTRYVNNMTQPVRAKLRSGLEMSFPAVPVRTARSHDQQFLVQHELIVGATCVEAARVYFKNLEENVPGALAQFREAYLKVYDNVYTFGREREIRCTIEYMFTERDLASTNGMFYHDELDTLFKFGDEPYQIPHPHSYAGRELEAEQAAEAIKAKHGFIFWVEIIDNLGKYGDRYLPICNQVYKIVARTDKNRPDGLYIVSSKPTNGKINPDEVSTTFYPFEDVEKQLGIYQTFEQASSFGDVAATRKREIATLEHSMLIERQNFQRDKLKYETELEENNRRLKEVEFERLLLQRSMEELKQRQESLLELEKLKMKDAYERKSHDRKDTSEFIKFLPTILAGIGTILMAYKAFRTNGVR